MPDFTTCRLGHEWTWRQTGGCLTASACACPFASHLLLTKLHTFLQDDNFKLPKKEKEKSAFVPRRWIRWFLLIPPGGQGSSRGAGQAAESSSASNPCSRICRRLLCWSPEICSPAWSSFQSMCRHIVRVHKEACTETACSVSTWRTRCFNP